MLADGEAAQWVAWKLDNGIHHLLLDEAQDTSPAQWQLLRRLGDEFFETSSEASGDSGPRTMFVVGDFKQSIYSFQGADPVVMGRNLELHDRAGTLAAPWREVGLDVSFRSARPVLDLVNLVVPSLDGISDPRMPGFRRTGRRAAMLAVLSRFCRLWPRMRHRLNHRPLRRRKFVNHATPRHSLRQDLPRCWPAGSVNADCPSGRVMRAGDVMVLLRSRGRYYRLLLAALQQAGIPVAGADRMKLEDQIEIQDLLALGDVMLLPEDDLQLAAVLKSPLIGIDEDDFVHAGT